MTDRNQYYAVAEDGVEVPVRIDKDNKHVWVKVPLEERISIKLYKKKNG